MNSFKNKYFKYKKKYLALKYGGSSQKEIYYYENKIYNQDDKKLQCKQLEKYIPKNTEEVEYCETRENRVKCIDNEEDKDYRFEQQEYNKSINPSEFNYYNCLNEATKKRTFSDKTIKENSTVIFGGGPVGLLTAIYAFEKGLRNVIVIEHRENYSRNQDVVLQSNTNYNTVGYLDEINFNGTTLLEDMKKKKIICPIDPPFTHIAICKENKDNMLGNYLVKIKELENYFEEVFLSKGGQIIRSKLSKKKIKSKFEKNENDYISITIENGPLYNIGKKKTIYNNITIADITHLLCCDGGRPSSRIQLSELLPDSNILDYSLYDGTDNNYPAELKNNEIKDEDNLQHIVSYGVACNVLIEEDIVKQIEDNNYELKNQNSIRFFIPYGNPKYTITKNGKTYIKAYLGIQVRTDNIERYLKLEEINEIIYKSLFKIRDREKITKVLKIIKDIANVATPINEVFRKNDIKNEDYNFLDNILKTCYHISIFPIQLYSAKKYLIEENELETKIAFIGDASFGVHYFSGTGVNIGMSFGKHIIDYFKDEEINRKSIEEKYNTFVNAIKTGSTGFIIS